MVPVMKTVEFLPEAAACLCLCRTPLTSPVTATIIRNNRSEQ